MKEKLTSLGHMLFGDSVRAFGVVSLIFLGSLAIAPAKNFFSEFSRSGCRNSGWSIAAPVAMSD